MTALEHIAAERDRQISMGFDAHHDDLHTDGSLAVCASGLLFMLDGKRDADGWTLLRITHIRQTRSDREQLIIAAALIVAEIERLDRQTQIVSQ